MRLILREGIFQMKKTLSLIIVMSICTIFTYAHATIITYNITGGVDSEGNKFSGFVDINSVAYTIPPSVDTG